MTQATVDAGKGAPRSRLFDYFLGAALAAFLILAFVMDSGGELDGLVGAEAPAFELRSRSGKTLGPGDFRGQTVVLDFWATWCTPCFRQMPKLARAVELVGDDVVVLSVNVDEAVADRDHKIDRFIESAKVDFDTLVDNGTAQQLYGVRTLPSLVVVGPDGVVRWAATGVHDTAELVEAIEGARHE